MQIVLSFIISLEGLILTLSMRDGRGRVFSCRAGQRSKSSERDGAGQGKGQNLQGQAGQNVIISADLDHLIKEGKP